MIDCGFQHYLLEKAYLVRAQPGLLTALLEYLTVLLEYLDFSASVAGHCKNLGGSGCCKACPWLCHCEKVRKYTTKNYYSSMHLYIVH